MTARIEVKRAEAADLDMLAGLNGQVQDLHAALYPEYFKPRVDPDRLRAFLTRAMSGAGDAFLIATSDGVGAGYAWLGLQHRLEPPFSAESKRVYLHHICVDAAHRRRGVASALMDAARRIARENGAGEIMLDTWAANEEAQAFFRSCGFEPMRLMMRASVQGVKDGVGPRG